METTGKYVGSWADPKVCPSQLSDGVLLQPRYARGLRATICTVFTFAEID